MRSRRSFLGLCLVAAVSQWLGHDFIVFRGSKSNVSAMAWTQNLLGLCLFGCVPDAAFLGFAWWLKFRSGWGTISLFLGVPKATFRDFWGCSSAMAWTQNLLGLCLFGCAPDAAFLGFARWLKFRSGWGTISLCLGVPNATFRDFWGCTPAMAWTQNLLGLYLFGCAPDASFLGFARWLKFRSGWGTISLCLGVPNATFRDFWGCTPAMAWTQNLLGLLPFRMRSRRSFLTLCLVADPRSGWGTFSLRLHSCNGLDAKPAGALPFGCAPDAAFLGFAWWQTFRSGWGTFSLFLWGTISLFLGVPKATFQDFWGCTPAMAWTQNLLGLCLFGCASDAAFLGFAWSNAF